MRATIIVNLDPANDSDEDLMKGSSSLVASGRFVNISDLINVRTVMKKLKLGPNGAMMYCVEYLEKQIEWLLEKISDASFYYLFDIPGQSELVTHNKALVNIIRAIQSKLDFRLVTVHLVDATNVRDASKFISVATLSLISMMRIEMPHVNVLSKFDLIKNELNQLQLPLDFYQQMQNPSYLTHFLLKQPSPSSTGERNYKLKLALCELIEEYDLVNFMVLDVNDLELVQNLIATLDKAIGYISPAG